jgi:hypothetical protein
MNGRSLAALRAWVSRVRDTDLPSRCCDVSCISQLERGDDRAARRASSIRRRLKWKVGIPNPTGSKPNGMHWRTFVKLVSNHDVLLARTLAGAAEKFGVSVANDLDRYVLSSLSRETVMNRRARVLFVFGLMCIKKISG